MGKLVYKEDKYLNFLKDVDNDSLEVLVNIITKDKDGNLRDSEDLTLQDEYKNYYPEHKKYWDLIAADYQYFGGNTLLSAIRGHGVCYEEILKDVCKEVKVNLPKNTTVEIMEINLLLKTMEEALDGMNYEEREKLIKDLDLKTTDFSKQSVLIALQLATKTGGFFVYKLALIVVNSISKAIIGRGLSLAANAGLMRGLAVISGPVGWAVTGAWTAVSVAGPALRVTIPSTIYIAALRQAELNQDFFDLNCPHCKKNITSDMKFCSHCGMQL